ncbi:MAG TPA: class I SAM-dependent methyltransferase [Candidatus Dormibacteraeota bacterium]|nr:class I SAM-dependent methyltransferase [Candidatus Dormibacteraeota bacterium]
MTESVSFGRAADYYDRTRAVPDEVMARLVPELTTRLPAAEACLEVGVGTGRIAIPLVEAGVRIVGVDISAEMLGKLRAKRAGAWPQLAIADATRLPFRDATFGSAIVSHVLHLVPAWRRAVAEMVRVVRPGGVLAASRGGGGEGWHHAVRRHFFVEAGDPSWPPGMDDIKELDIEMEKIGAQTIPFPEMLSEDSSSIDELLEACEAGIWAACWSLDEATRRRAAAATRKWAAQEFGDPQARRPTVNGSVWRTYRLAQQR